MFKNKLILIFGIFLVFSFIINSNNVESAPFALNDTWTCLVNYTLTEPTGLVSWNSNVGANNLPIKINVANDWTTCKQPVNRSIGLQLSGNEVLFQFADVVSNASGSMSEFTILTDRINFTLSESKTLEVYVKESGGLEQIYLRYANPFTITETASNPNNAINISSLDGNKARSVSWGDDGGINDIIDLSASGSSTLNGIFGLTRENSVCTFFPGEDAPCTTERDYTFARQETGAIAQQIHVNNGTAGNNFTYWAYKSKNGYVVVDAIFGNENVCTSINQCRFVGNRFHDIDDTSSSQEGYASNATLTTATFYQGNDTFMGMAKSTDGEYYLSYIWAEQRAESSIRKNSDLPNSRDIRIEETAGDNGDDRFAGRTGTGGGAGSAINASGIYSVRILIAPTDGSPSLAEFQQLIAIEKLKFIAGINRTKGSETQFSSNSAPSNPVPLINTTKATNFTDEYLNIFYTPSDPEADPLTCNVDWYKNNVLNFGQTISCTSGSPFFTFLHPANTTRGDVWYGRTNVTDGTLTSSLITTSNITINNSLVTLILGYINSTSNFNVTNDNVTLTLINATDLDGDPVYNISDPRKWDGNSFVSDAVLNMPLEPQSNLTRAKDYSSNGNDGNIRGATCNSNNGVIGSGCDFDGINDIVDMGAKSSLNFGAGNNFAISAWYRRKPDTEGNQRLLSKGGTSSGEAGYNFFVGNTGITWGVSNGGGGEDGVDRILVGSGNHGPLSTDTWIHVVGMRNGGNISIYINGNLSDSNPNFTGSPATSEQLIIGRVSSSAILFFNGSIDQVMIWNRSLSENEITAIYNNQSIIHSDATSIDDIWTYNVTGNDGTADGYNIQTNNVTILSATTQIPDLHLFINNTNITFQTFFLNWSNVTLIGGGLSGTPTYLVQISSTKDFTSFIAVNYSVIERANVTNANFSISAGKRFWRVASTDGETNSSFSEPRTFIIDNIAPNITLRNPINASRNNTASIGFEYNVTESITTLQTCSFYHNQTGTWGINQSQTPVEGINNFSLNFGSNTLTTFLWNIECNDTLGNIAFSLNNNFTLTVDRVNPIVTIINPSPDNSTVVNGNFNLNITLEDASLFAFEFNITNSSGFGVAYNTTENFNASGNLSFFRIQDFINISNMSEGKFNITVLVSDAHTKTRIKDYKPFVDKINRELKYKTDEENSVVIKAIEVNKALTDLSTRKLEDRYTFTFNFSAPPISTNITFLVSSEFKLIYLKDSIHKGHFVSMNTIKKGGNWVDFNFQDNEAKYEIKRIDNNNYTVNIFTDENVLEFNSIGGLNIVTTDAFFTYNTSEVPIITLVSPSQNFKDTDGNITFEYNVTLNNSTIDSCSLYTDSVIDQTDKTITLNINQSFSKVYGEDDAHTWQVRCNNTNGNIGLSQIRDFSIGFVKGGEADDSNRGGGGAGVTCPVGTISSNGTCVPMTKAVIESIQEIAVDTKDVIGKAVQSLEESGDRIIEAIKEKTFAVLKAIDYVWIGTMALLIQQFIRIVSKKAKKKRMSHV